MQQKLEYIPGLNGIRAVSALLVILTHWPGTFLSIKLGWIGVNIFLVLSGFLITRILLVEREEKHLRDYIATFYYKRSLRIFPLYFGFLIGLSAFILMLSNLLPVLLLDATWASGYNAVKHDIGFFLSFTYNLKQNLRTILNLTDSPTLFFSHMWSLALEEQFYLAFPFVVYFASIKNLRRIIITLLILCPVARLIISLYGAEIITDKYLLGEILYTNTFLQSDALAAGALLAVYNFNLTKKYLLFAIASITCVCVGVIQYYFITKSGHYLSLRTFGLNFPGFWFMQDTPYFLLDIKGFYQFSIINFLAVSMILPAIKMKPIFASILTQKHVNYFGKISYGIYVFHNPLIALMLVAFNLTGHASLLQHPLIEVAAFIVFFSILLFVSHLSYAFFESKILRLANNRKVRHNNMSPSDGETKLRAQDKLMRNRKIHSETTI